MSRSNTARAQISRAFGKEASRSTTGILSTHTLMFKASPFHCRTRTLNLGFDTESMLSSTVGDTVYVSAGNI